MNIMWFKKDLRFYDNAALAHALEHGPTTALYIFEPEWFKSVEFHPNHLVFVLDSLNELKKVLHSHGIPLIFRYGHCIEVFKELHKNKKITGLFSHQETGLFWSFERDLAVQTWCRENAVPWTECKQFGVVRKLKDRDTWNEKRSQIIERPVINPKGQSPINSPWPNDNAPLHIIENFKLKTDVQIGGSQKSYELINSFLGHRGLNYFRSISSPQKAFESCSRLSPYITWGNISITQIHHAIQKKRHQIENLSWHEKKDWSLTLKQFENRIWWHCHFIQKLETEPEIEFQNFNREFDGMREADFDEAKFQAWCKGETGFPLIDACMRSLLTHGWLNFRMRALLMSFASYQLWLHWKRPAEHLARHFIDFEPGIHYSQAQMQSGVTGINAIRIYSPKKQTQDQDPEGLFIKKYIPELQNVPSADLADLNQIPPLLQLDLGFKLGESYPHPIVDAEKSYALAKEKIFKWKKDPKVQKVSETVLKIHGSRGHKNFPKQNRQN
jgi:deoxyribodipyrimidine photo-lyase